MAKGKSSSARRREGSAVTSTLALPAAPSNVDLAQSSRELTRDMISRRVKQSDTTGRRKFGASTDMIAIAGAIESANNSLMWELTDLESEMMMLDPTLGAYASKRFGALQAADWDVTPPEGLSGTDREWGAKIASDVHALFSKLSIPEAVFDLGWSHFHGRAALETNWAFGAWGHKVAPYSFDWVHPRRLSFGSFRELRVIEPWAGGRPFDSERGIPVEETPGKFLFMKPRLFCEFAEREGLGPRSMYWCFFKRFDWRHRMQLTELFAIPWRVVELDDGDTAAAPGSIETARAEVDNMSGSASAVMPAGTKLRLEWPGENSGSLFEKTHEQVNDELAKLWLGNTATTQQGNGSRAEGIIGKGEEDILFQRDGNGVSHPFDPLIRTFVRLNYGDMALHLCPRFQLRTAPVRDRAKELERAKLALSMGLTIAESELREITGFRAPTPEEKFLRMGSGGTDAMGNPTPGAIEVVDPAERADTPVKEIARPDVQMAPTDLAVVITVNEARASAGLPPLDGPDGDLTLAEFKAKNASTIAEGAAAIDGVVVPGPGEAPAKAGKPPAPSDDEPAPAERAEDDVVDRGVDGQAEDALRSLLGMTRAYACDGHEGKQVPATAVYGSPELLVEKGVRDGARECGKWAAAFASAVDGAHDAVSVRRALGRVEVDLEPFARSLERRLVHALMLGALDADWEAENDRVVKPPAFAISTTTGERVEESEEERRARYGIATDERIALAGGVPNFVASPFAEAIRMFKARNVLTRRVFDRLQAAAKQRAFTVATLTKKSMLEAAKAELVTALEDGDDLRRFRARLTERFEEAGWTPLKPSHVETVFRTNTMSAYSRGRDEQMDQPSVLAARPFRQALGVDDSRTRPAHRKAHGKVIAANDPARARLRTPWGYNCFLPETRVAGRFIGASRALYDGKFVQLTTKKGRRLTVTAQHPVLSAHGFTAAESIRVGDDLICYAVEKDRPRTRGPQHDDHKGEAQAQEVFNALARTAHRGSASAAGDDFHGEAKRFVGEIEVVGSYGMLPTERESAVAAGALQFSLVEADRSTTRAGASSEFTFSNHTTARSRVRCSNLGGARGGMHPTPLHSLSIGGAADLDTMLDETIADEGAREMKLARELLEAGAGSVLLDRVVDVREFFARGHVHDLETIGGWLVADGIIASNCRDRWVSRSAKDVERLGLEVVPGASLVGLPDEGWDGPGGF